MGSRIVIVENQEWVRKGIQVYIEMKIPEIQIQAYKGYADAKKYIQSGSDPSVDLFILDGNLESNRKGYELIPYIKPYFPAAKILTFSSSENLNDMALKAGAHEAFLKYDDDKKFIMVVRQLLKK